MLLSVELAYDQVTALIVSFLPSHRLTARATSRSPIFADGARKAPMPIQLSHLKIIKKITALPHAREASGCLRNRVFYYHSLNLALTCVHMTVHWNVQHLHLVNLDSHEGTSTDNTLSLSKIITPPFSKKDYSRTCRPCKI